MKLDPIEKALIGLLSVSAFFMLASLLFLLIGAVSNG